MSYSDAPKKRPQGRKEKPAGDWHPADVKAALEKAGWTLRRLSAHHGFRSKYLAAALRKQHPMAEGLIAEQLGLHPKQIWPSRYDPAGLPTCPIKRGRVVPKNIPPRSARHVLNGGAV